MKDSEIENLNWSDWPLPDSYLIEVGRVTALWSSMESFLNMCIGKLSGFSEDDPRWFILVNHSTFPQRLDMLAALCEHLLDKYPHLAEYKAAVSALRSAQKERNKFAHNGLGPGEKSGEIVMVTGSARGSLRTNIENIKIADVRRAAVSIDKAFRRLYKLVLQRDLTPPWTRRGQSDR
jgi:hypothetical protein